MITAQSIAQDLAKVRATNPLVHSITNYVVMNNTANALLAIGASPIMAHAEAEMAEMVAITQALVLNIGTLSPHWVNAMQVAAQEARRLQKPIVLDPVGVGATTYRKQTAQQLMQTAPPNIIRGNASEIKALADVATQQAKGVDSTESADAALLAAELLAKNFDCVVCISGETDYVVSTQGIIAIANGHPLMTKVTGMGCTATALIGAFAAVNPNYLQATAHAMAIMGIVGEWAAAKAQGPGTLQLHFLDGLYALEQSTIQTLLKTSEKTLAR